MDGIEALEKAYKKDGAYLLSVCRRYVRDADTARDMFQDGFVSAYTNWSKFTDRGPGSLKAWLARIMANTCLMYLRKRDPVREADEIDTVPLKAVSDDSLAGSIAGIKDEDLYNMILNLPDVERTVLNMFVFEGFSHKDIAHLLGIKESASAMRFYRAKAHLAEMIEKYEKR
ncbi:MAG: sigma-70 family RNA polymerase sigma factor [Bacteroidales bacterium]|nr:sigma-70 family RNA polymerase sigma factor [Bacteroidales bacterium]MBQ7458444.1 sigma-70 family RNA polymerase sigma factor [Bacteroidales bacterium]MBQ9529757.1 sigma-70 family RNA polymerase sigma factor [Bacteroidales bacterium]